MAHALVLGGGFGGISAALELRRLLDHKHTVTMVDEGDSFRMGLGNLWILDGRRQVGEGRRPLANLESAGIKVVRGKVESITAASRTVVVNGTKLNADGIIVALGTRKLPEATPGSEVAHNIYTEAGAASFATALQKFSGGRILIQVCGLPFQCPPAPYEAALLTADVLRRRGIKAEIHLATPEPHPLPVAPPENGNRLLPLLAAAGIIYHPNSKPTRFSAKTVDWEAGGSLGFDLAAFVPIHKAPAVIEASELAGPAGFIPVDATSLRTKFAGVFAVGDVAAVPLANGKMLPKAGVLAEAQGRAAATHLAQELSLAGTPTKFEGQGICFIELGNGKAIPAEGHFFAIPQPEFTFRDASAAGLQEKEMFEADRLAAWFGPGKLPKR